MENRELNNRKSNSELKPMVAPKTQLLNIMTMFYVFSKSRAGVNHQCKTRDEFFKHELPFNPFPTHLQHE